MAKNIIIYSDGTGQAGGLWPDEWPDENRSNIYKLYRATRCGPDTDIDPREQLTFYDAGLGSQPPGGAFFVTRAYRWLHNVASQATGLGITTNIIDCYAAIIRMWEPGDRIFVIGFSRGAYTVRCLAAVLSLCGVPTRMKDGGVLRRDVKSTTAIAKEAVKDIYQHVSSPKDAAYLAQRKALASRFREAYGCDADGSSNAVPFFVGVFDTVASLGSYLLSGALIGGVAAAIWTVSFVQSFFLIPLWPAFFWMAGLTTAAAVIGYIATHLKFARGLEGYSFRETLHLARPKMEFYDLHLDNEVWYARHALAIDENRKDFARVQWGGRGNKGPERPEAYPDWLQQIWFSGNHSDIGGSYPENEARLSDIAVGWMVHAAVNLPDAGSPTGNGIKIDSRYLKLNPDALGPQHDAREPGYLRGRLKWPEGPREVEPVAMLHSSVYDRFAAKAVRHFYDDRPYRPANLAKHEKLSQYYGGSAAPSQAQAAAVPNCPAVAKAESA